MIIFFISHRKNDLLPYPPPVFYHYFTVIGLVQTLTTTITPSPYA